METVTKDERIAALELALKQIREIVHEEQIDERLQQVMKNIVSESLGEDLGALLEHDTETRRKALLEAEGIFPDSPRSGEDWTPRQVRMRLRRFAEEGAKNEERKNA